MATAGGALRAGTVAALYRYPVKSTAGQLLRIAPVMTDRFQHDRQWAAYTADGGIASGKRTRRFRPVPGLMQWQSTAHDGDDVPYLISPAGQRFRVDDPVASSALSAAFDQPLTLRAETTIQHYDESPVHVVTTSSLAAAQTLIGVPLDRRRVRSNIIIDTGVEPWFLEDEWAGGLLAIGPEVLLRLGPAMTRCVMIDQDQRGVAARPHALKPLGMHHDARLGVQASVLRAGNIQLRDPVTWLLDA